MKIYHARNEFNEFIYRDKKSITEAREHPVRRGTYILPARASFDAPPPYKIGYATVLVRGEWFYVEDNRGKDFWDVDGQKVEVKLGRDVSRLLRSPPPKKKTKINDLPSLADEDEEYFVGVLRQMRDAAMKEYCDKFAAINFWSDVKDTAKMKVWKEYRQKLLDLPKNENTLKNLKGKIIAYQKNNDIYSIIPRPPGF